MFLRFLIFTAVAVAGGILAFAYLEVPPGRSDAVDWAHAAVNAVTSHPGDPVDYVGRIRERRWETAGHLRQEAGARAFGHAPSGKVVRTVVLPSGTSDGPRLTRSICHLLLNNGFVPTIEAQFPSIAKTNSHQLTIESTTTQGTDGARSAIVFSFQYTGFIRQGDPRKIGDYAEALVRKEVNARCWADAGFDAHPPRIPDASETAVITDLPGEPDTAAAQDKVFFGDSPSIFKEVPAAPPAEAPVPPANPPLPQAPSAPAAQSAIQPVPSDNAAATPTTALVPVSRSGTPSTGDEAYAGERQHRIDELQRQLDNINIDIHVASKNREATGGTHLDASGTYHPDSVGTTVKDRLATLMKQRDEVEAKIRRLKGGAPLSSVPSDSSTSMDTLGH